ncbi:MAG: KH domain-containing protein, partial [Gammaproteobacteria bacterium]
MGQKVHPVGIRLGIVKKHNSNWYASPKNYADFLITDLKVRDHLYSKLKNASVSRILIERPSENARITISTARPGIVIGKKGEDGIR